MGTDQRQKMQQTEAANVHITGSEKKSSSKPEIQDRKRKVLPNQILTHRKLSRNLIAEETEKNYQMTLEIEGTLTVQNQGGNREEPPNDFGDPGHTN